MGTPDIGLPSLCFRYEICVDPAAVDPLVHPTRFPYQLDLHIVCTDTLQWTAVRRVFLLLRQV